MDATAWQEQFRLNGEGGLVEVLRDESHIDEVVARVSDLSTARGPSMILRSSSIR
jgi:hypothetical protein